VPSPAPSTRVPSRSTRPSLPRSHQPDGAAYTCPHELRLTTMSLPLVALSGVLILVAPVPYLIDVRRGHTKPRLVTWLIWALLPAIASATAFATHQLPAAVLSLCVTFEACLVVVLGYKCGDRTLDGLDLLCLIGALIALGLWAFLRAPGIAALLIVATDFIAAIPTFRHSWVSPHEETWLEFALSALAGAVTLLAADFAVLTAVAYPLYLFIVNLAMTAIIVASPHRGRASPYPTFSSGSMP
jgi:hypothetical protein